MNDQIVIVRHLGLQPYQEAWQSMQQFTNTRDENTIDEIWVLEHPPIFTQGQNGKPEHILNPGDIPVIQADRGGQVTYHGPGQLVLYTLIDIRRKKINVRQMVTHLEQSVIQLLADYDIIAAAKCQAPGVYIENKKICSIGLRIRRGCSFHGLALNINMDLEPFNRITPCGLTGIEMTQLSKFHNKIELSAVQAKLVEYLSKNLGYNKTLTQAG